MPIYSGFLWVLFWDYLPIIPLDADKMDLLWKFVIWFCASLISVFLFITLIQNPFLKSFVIALIISVLAVTETEE